MMKKMLLLKNVIIAIIANNAKILFYQIRVQTERFLDI